MQKVTQLGEFFDVRGQRFGFAEAQPHHHAEVDDVVVAREFGVEPGADLEHGGGFATPDNAPATGRVNACHGAQHGAFACAVVPDQADSVAVFEGEADVFEGSDDGGAAVFFDVAACGHAHEVAAQRHAVAAVDGVAQADVVKLDGGHGAQTQNARFLPCVRWQIQVMVLPTSNMPTSTVQVSMGGAPPRMGVRTASIM